MTAKIFDHLAPAVFAALVFTVSCELSARDLINEIKHPARLIRISAAGMLAVPLITAAVFKLFNADIVVTGIAVVAAIAPGDSFALLEAESKKARMDLAAVIMALFCILMPFTVPLWLGPLSRFFHLTLKASPADIFGTVAPITILPLALGLLLREYLPGVSDILKKVTRLFFRAAVIIVAAICLFAAVKGLAHYTPASLGAIFVAVSAALFTGYYCGLPDRKDRLTSGLSVSLGNFALVLLVAHASYPGAHIAPQAIVFVLIRWAVIMFWYLIFRARLREQGVIL